MPTMCQALYPMNKNYSVFPLGAHSPGRNRHSPCDQNELACVKDAARRVVAALEMLQMILEMRVTATESKGVCEVEK